MRLIDVKKGLSVFMFEDRGVEKVSIVKVIDGRVTGRITAAKDFVEQLRGCGYVGGFYNHVDEA